MDNVARGGTKPLPQLQEKNEAYNSEIYSWQTYIFERNNFLGLLKRIHVTVH